jgi:hypothetical protein
MGTCYIHMLKELHNKYIYVIIILIMKHMTGPLRQQPNRFPCCIYIYIYIYIYI